ncbi:MAG: tRNA (adenosine(37)-N6)-threonylcarbamoyltransferase complex ATPase subunit type 1 TsaE [Paludisphaera borealis]|uniref:tRNA (adenosine(37)-N6)-threonylcarbamoyltransferase complex ATPase subunit type 1 TsaE n=1 Tax=Paludisphaera borealis TaxID=1387353 RepID=UPI0028459CA0|nr:tRNA (adenosine(37)-N6)-threonylcarbamoyltransferase complex ATPase subunit type 1 TsaE [Paludisphaera borealis]MDR3622012.1 tRNA (adenosine(37)-N6)-threonylcarbamoyltransferase complex ATPase subunit type 1 TsaE [Paludisphaera borealis]
MNILRTESGLQIDLDDEGETERLGRALADVLAPNVVVGLVGPLGAGKTRLSRAIAESLGVDPGAIASPTFVLIHEYEGRMPVYHFDVYRLTSSAEFEDLGPADYWKAGGVCLVEWADRVRNLLPADAWWIAIEPLDASSRRVRIDLPEASPRLPDRLIAALTHGSDDPDRFDGPDAAT